MRDISKRFGATRALRGVCLDAYPGKVLALIGENGAGKSTLMKVLSGAHAPDAGTMELAGNTYRPRTPHQGRVAGVAMIYQELNLAPDLSVEDNIMLGQEQRRWRLLDRRSQQRRIHDVLRLLGHPDLRPETPVQGLSIAAQQLVEIARALVMDAKLIVFDEPTSSLTRHDTEKLFEVIQKLKAAGVGIVYISHFLEEIREICDSFTVLRDGEVVGGGELAAVTEVEIISLMVGRSVNDLFPKVPHEPGEVLLVVDKLSGETSPKKISFELRRGEILGIAGLVGAGRTELLRCLFGLDAVREGSVTIAGIQPSARPRARMKAGMAFVSEDRKGEGLAQGLSIADNATLSRFRPYNFFGGLNLWHRRNKVAELMRDLQIRAASPDQAVAELSGGNQQKVALARVLHENADILLLDEPTRGIDVGTKVEIYRLIGRWAAEGKAVVFVSSYLPELMAVCDRIGVMSRGRLQELRPVSEWTEESVMACAIGGE